MPSSVVSRKLESPTNLDVAKVKRIFRYLKGTIEFGLIYTPGMNDQLLSYSDADHGGDEMTGRSTSGVLCMYAGGAVSWLSQRQTSVAISSTEAEVVAASEAAREIVWLNRLYKELIYITATPCLHVDNEAAIRLKIQNFIAVPSISILDISLSESWCWKIILT